MYNYLRLKQAAVELEPQDSPVTDDYVASVRDYRPYEEAAIKNKKALEDIYGFTGGHIGGIAGIGLGWYGTDALTRNTKLSDRAKNTAKVLGAIGLGAFGEYAGDTFGRQLSPGVVVHGRPTVPVTLRKKVNKPITNTIDTNFIE